VVILSGGRTVAAGRPAELARRGGVEVETDAGTQRFPDASREEAPDIVAGLVAAGERVYEVRVITSSLEDVYLEAVGGQSE
jgi:ABC-2 type transport system ATP-binding protein